MMGLLMMFLGSLVLASQPTPLMNQPRDRYDNGYTEDRYHEVLDHLIKVYEPIIQAQGGVFIIDRDWSDGAVNMWAERIGNEFILEVPGGMARYHLISEEGFISSLCHELGHLLGGPPGGLYISYEGQSDYYAGQSCIAKVLGGFSPQKTLPLDLEVAEICQGDQLCSRSLQGMKSLTSYYAELEGVGFPQFKTPSTVEVSKTLTAHPPAQCRLDTFLAGYQNRPRPRCWYKAE